MKRLCLEPVGPNWAVTDMDTKERLAIRPTVNDAEIALRHIEDEEDFRFVSGLTRKPHV